MVEFIQARHGPKFTARSHQMAKKLARPKKLGKRVTLTTILKGSSDTQGSLAGNLKT
jgi:hypothetical protein